MGTETWDIKPAPSPRSVEDNSSHSARGWPPRCDTGTRQPGSKTDQLTRQLLCRRGQFTAPSCKPSEAPSSSWLPKPMPRPRPPPTSHSASCCPVSQKGSCLPPPAHPSSPATSPMGFSSGDRPHPSPTSIWRYNSLPRKFTQLDSYM